MFFATLDYVREQGLSPVDYAHWAGRHFAPGWEDMRGDMQQIACYVALNAIATGSELKRYDVSDDEATIQFTRDHISEYGDDVEVLSEIYVPIMEFLDVDYELEKAEAVDTVHLRQ